MRSSPTILIHPIRHLPHSRVYLFKRHRPTVVKGRGEVLCLIPELPRPAAPGVRAHPHQASLLQALQCVARYSEVKLSLRTIGEFNAKGHGYKESQ